MFASRRWAGSIFTENSSRSAVPLAAGTNAIPQIGHRPGPGWRIIGCIGQVKISPVGTAVVVDGPSAARIHPKRWATPTITISAMAAARNNPSGSSFLVIQANRLGVGDEEDAEGVILAFDGSFGITKPFRSPWREQNNWQLAVTALLKNERQPFKTARPIPATAWGSQRALVASNALKLARCRAASERIALKASRTHRGTEDLRVHA
jgi:hypothetical protein